MGSASSSFGLPTNPRVEQADTETRSWQKRMEIDTPSLVKLSHGTIRYREPQEHRKPKLPRVGKPHEAPHHGKDRVGKRGYFYHPKLTDFSSTAAYTKEEAAKFHYVQEPPNGAKGRKVFFVVGVGMPKEVMPPESSGDLQEARLENLEGEEEKEQETQLQGAPAAEGEKKEGEEVENKEKGEEEKKEEGEKEIDNDEEPFKPKEFKGTLVPVSRIPKKNELPVYPERIRIISRAKDQLYYVVEFCDPVSVDVAKNEARERLFLASSAADAKEAAEPLSETAGSSKESAEPSKDSAGPSPKTAPEAEGSLSGAADAELGIFMKVIEETEPPTLSVVFGEKDTAGQVRKVVSAELGVSPTKINFLHEEKYVSSFNKLSTLAPAHVMDGFRYCIHLRPM